MLIGIHKDLYNEFGPFIEKYESILKINGIESIRLEINEPEFWDKVKDLDIFIFRWQHNDDHHQIAETILPVIENQLQIKCFPDLNTCWHFDDKIRQYYLLKNMSFPIIESHVFFDKNAAYKWASNAHFPVVFKLKGGAGSMNVVLVKTKKQAIKVINRMFGRGVIINKIPFKGNTSKKDFNLYKYIHRLGGNFLRKINDRDVTQVWQKHKNYVLFQDFMPNNDFDTRITIIGNRAFGFRRLNRKNDFRSSGSGYLEYDVNEIDIEFIKIAFEISKKMKFQSMAYDFLYDHDKNPVLCEISYTFKDSAVFNCPGYWDDQMQWHKGNYWPQYCQLVDLLGLENLKQPIKKGH